MTHFMMSCCSSCSKIPMMNFKLTSSSMLLLLLVLLLSAVR
jgi:hypothetical protein